MRERIRLRTPSAPDRILASCETNIWVMRMSVLVNLITTHLTSLNFVLNLEQYRLEYS
jgi:hypothetical protein